MGLRRHAAMLEALYASYNRREYVHPDPVELLYAYDDPADREIAALVAASLAYGRVAQILRSVSCVLERMGARPRQFVQGASADRLRRLFGDFRHRFQTGRELAALLWALKALLRRHGGLNEFFLAATDPTAETVLPALGSLAGELNAAVGGACGHLLPDPTRGSACKRLHLFLRWMVRRDGVDPGGWTGVSPAKLIVPLDTHMHRIAALLGATRRRTLDLRTAQEVTAAFRAVSPGDPARYDFALTRFGIRREMDLSMLLSRCKGRRARNV
jgi:uncharacterized protein (TIGR02757 family)